VTFSVQNVRSFTASFYGGYITFVQHNAPARFLGTFLPYPHFLFVRWNHDFVRNFKIKVQNRLRHDPIGWSTPSRDFLQAARALTSQSEGVLDLTHL
jgi:hypothetical protein